MKESPLFIKIDCLRIPVENLKEGLEFYSEKLGHELIWKNQNSAGLRLGNDKSEIVLYTEPEGLEIDFYVKNINDAIKRFANAGGRIILGPFDIQIGKAALVEDPWGNKYILLDSSKGHLKTDKEKNVIGII